MNTLSTSLLYQLFLFKNLELALYRSDSIFNRIFKFKDTIKFIVRLSKFIDL